MSEFGYNRSEEEMKAARDDYRASLTSYYTPFERDLRRGYPLWTGETAFVRECNIGRAVGAYMKHHSISEARKCG